MKGGPPLYPSPGKIAGIKLLYSHLSYSSPVSNLENWITILTSHDADFDAVCDFFDEKDIPYSATEKTQSLHAGSSCETILKVKEEDVARALDLLIEMGLITEKELEPSPISMKLDKWSALIPLIGKIPFAVRISILVPTLITLFVGILFLIFSPTTEEKLILKTWCAEQIKYRGKEFIPNTVTALRISILCNERVHLSGYGSIALPGFNTEAVKARWSIDNKTLRIQEADNFDFVYNGTYKIKFSNNSLILESPTTTIYCYSNQF